MYFWQTFQLVQLNAILKLVHCSVGRRAASDVLTGIQIEHWQND